MTRDHLAYPEIKSRLRPGQAMGKLPRHNPVVAQFVIPSVVTEPLPPNPGYFKTFRHKTKVLTKGQLGKEQENEAQSNNCSPS